MGGRHQRGSGGCFQPILLDATVAAPSEGGECWEFVRYCHDFRGLAPSTMEGYVSSVVKHARIMQSRTFVVPQLYRDWMTRMKQVPRPPRSRAPITKDVVWAAATRERASPATRVALVMAYYTGMRLGELVSRKVLQYEELFTVRRGDVEFDTEGRFAKFVNRGGKSDRFNRTTKRFLMAAGQEAAFCPVAFLRDFMQSTAVGSSPSDPLLQHVDGRMVVRRHVVDLVKRVAMELGYDPKTVQGHSIRIGAATALAEAGVEFSTIMQFGGWLSESSCVKYLRWTETRLRTMSEALALTGDVSSPSSLLKMAMAADAVVE